MLMFFSAVGFLVSVFNVYCPIKIDLRPQIDKHPLQSAATVPAWLVGTLVRNGPINIESEGNTNRHWFDGLAMLHSIQLNGVSPASYSNKFLQTHAYASAVEHDVLNYGGFAVHDENVLERPACVPKVSNANINVVKIGDGFAALTEAALPVGFDLQSLQTSGALQFSDDLPTSSCYNCAHPIIDPLSGDMFNFMVHYGPISHYILYKLAKGSLRREKIATLPTQRPSYMHGFSMTKNYLILTAYPLVNNPVEMATQGQTFYDNLQWMEGRPTTFIVVNRHSKEVVGRYVAQPFFAFHHINAFEDERGIIHVDILAYKDASVIKRIKAYVGQDHSALLSGKGLNTAVKRYSINLTEGLSERCLYRLGNTTEFPRINESFVGRDYQYIYATALPNIDMKLNTCGVYKIDLLQGKHQTWFQDGCFPGEPVFVASPDSLVEDAGVVLSIVADVKNSTSFLLILDAQTFNELARMALPHKLPAGLHGQFFSSIAAGMQ